MKKRQKLATEKREKNPTKTRRKQTNKKLSVLKREKKQENKQTTNKQTINIFHHQFLSAKVENRTTLGFDTCGHILFLLYMVT